MNINTKIFFINYKPHLVNVHKSFHRLVQQEKQVLDLLSPIYDNFDDITEIDDTCTALLFQEPVNALSCERC